MEKGEKLVDGVIEGEEKKRGEEMVEEIFEEILRQLDYLMGEEEDYLDEGEGLSERVRQELDRNTGGILAYSQPLSSHINNNIYKRTETRYI